MAKGFSLKTKHGYKLSAVASALQKSIRRGDVRVAGYFGIELFESNFAAYFWRRMKVISAEDIFAGFTAEIESLCNCWQEAHAHRKGSGRIFLAKAIVLLCRAAKSRDADHLTNLLYDASAVPAAELDAAIAEVESIVPEGEEPVPDYAYDVHTSEGRKAGKTKADFFKEEDAALKPRAQGLLDDLLK